MATEEECLTALENIASRLSDVDPAQFARHAVERTVSCRVADLGIVFRTRVHPGGLDPFDRVDGTPNPPGRAQVRVTVNSDDLVALSRDELHIATAWATGRLTIEARPGDLLRLARLL